MRILILDHYEDEVSGLYLIDTEKLDKTIPKIKAFIDAVTNTKVEYTPTGSYIVTGYSGGYQDEDICEIAEIPINPSNIDKIVEIYCSDNKDDDLYIIKDMG